MESIAMLTNAATTSIDCFHSRVKHDRADQITRILAVMQPNQDYSMQELHILTGISTATLSARLFEMRDEKHGCLVEHAQKRKCSISGVTIEPHRIKRGQKELFS